MTAVLPAWMYGNPADVAQRKEQSELNRVERHAGERLENARVVRRERYGLVSDATVRLVKRERVRELVARVKEGSNG